MPSGIILQSSSSRGAATDEERMQALENVLTANGHEADKPEVAAEETAEAPKRDDFASDEDFEAAEEAHETRIEEAEQAEEENEAEAERKRLEALPKKSRRQRAVEKATAEMKKQLDDATQRIAALEGKKQGATAAV